MRYYATAFFSTAVATGLYAIIDVTESAPTTGALLFAVFLIAGAFCWLCDHLAHTGSRRKDFHDGIKDKTPDSRDNDVHSR